MAIFTALSVLVATHFTTTYAQNTTSSPLNNDGMKTGWQDGPNQRGTITILWSCLTTVIACTWTILHLNVPGSCDTIGWKILRKAKWMLVTILFPEFLFSKAVCELQMAVDDLAAMAAKKKILGPKFQWQVGFGRGLQRLHGLFHLFSKPLDGDIADEEEATESTSGENAKASDEHAREQTAAIYPSPNSNDLQDWTREERIWTLAHSYFANMGGFQRHHPRGHAPPCQEGTSCEEGKPNPITAYALVNCCVGSDHDPLPSLHLDRDEIEDKSKADWFLKSIAIMQISWLLLSVIVRAAAHLPITQLEICTSAFGLLAIATYMANWSKPKDIGTPMRFRIVDDTYQCEAWKYYGEPFMRRLYRPSESGKADVDGGAEKPPPCYRIKNDFVRLEGFIPPMTITMAISTAIFGGLHCLAWNFAFPTSTEMMIWMVASVLSATIPLATLLANIAVVSRIHRAMSQCAANIFAEMHSTDLDDPPERTADRVRTETLLSLSKLLSPSKLARSNCSV
jgi:hypothetical protein